MIKTCLMQILKKYFSRYRIELQQKKKKIDFVSSSPNNGKRQVYLTLFSNWYRISFYNTNSMRSISEDKLWSIITIILNVVSTIVLNSCTNWIFHLTHQKNYLYIGSFNINTILKAQLFCVTNSCCVGYEKRNLGCF